MLNRDWNMEIEVGRRLALWVLEVGKKKAWESKEARCDED